MAIYFAVIAAGCALFVVALACLVVLIRSGQLDDLQTPAIRMLHDDATPAAPSASEETARV